MLPIASPDGVPIQVPQADHDNPLLTRWDEPFGMPPFDRIDAAHFESAYEIAFAQHLAQVQAIADDPAAADFDNTVVALELAGGLLERINGVFWNLCDSHTNPALQAAERVISPRLAAHRSAVFLNSALFARLDALHAARESLSLDDQQRRVLERLHRDFVMAGARLSEDQKQRCARIVTRLAELATAFAQNVLADEAQFQLVLREVDELSGLPDFVRDAARQLARDRGLAEAWVITLSRSSIEAFLTFSDRRDLREQAYRAWMGRGGAAGPHDNRPLISELLALRRTLAQLHGHVDFAHYALSDRMAAHPDAVTDLLARVWTPACVAAHRERDELQALAHQLGHALEIEAWDWRYYADRVRRERFAVDAARIKPYLQLERMTQAMFDCATRLFGVHFTEQPHLPRYHPSVRTWAVTDRDGRHLSVFMADNFSRTSKRGGAWMSQFRGQCGLTGQRPIVVNNNNFSAAAPGEPVLLSIEEARTLFHEFGHALHGMLSEVSYPRLSGTQVQQDFVELPSQLFEHWLFEPEVLSRHALHVQTGEPMPPDLIASLRAARTVGQGFATVEYAACALLDMAVHQHPDPVSLDIETFEREALVSIGMPRAMAMRHRLPHFGHLFSGQDYAAGYYVYLWAEVLDADGFQAFVEAGDRFDPTIASRLLRYIYSAGDRRDPAQAYRLFRGRDAHVGAMLKQRGFEPVPG